MNIIKEQLRLYAVTDRTWTKEQTLYEQVEAALMGGVTMVQLREKHGNRRERYEEAKRLLTLCRSYRVPLLINDDVELAACLGADGVHVGQKDMPADKARTLLGRDKIIGVSAKTVEQAGIAKEAGADYLGVGAAFATGTKRDASVIPHNQYQAIKEAVGLPIVAIGGITKENINELRSTGVDGVALVSAIFAAEHIEDTCRELRSVVDSWFATKDGV